MLDQAEKENFLKRQTDGAVVLEDSARATIRSMYVMQLTQLLSQAARTLQERPELVTAKSATIHARPVFEHQTAAAIA
jgi:hypothetical protein